MMKRDEIIKTGAKLPAKKNGKMKNVKLAPRFKRAIPKPRRMNPIVIRYKPLYFNQKSPS